VNGYSTEAKEKLLDGIYVKGLEYL
jgi:hypothetical protein